jgi:hypothetical protein
MILEEISLGKDEESKRKAIQGILGQHAILSDLHESWCHCKILEDGYDNQVYQVQIGDRRGKRQLHYHDLNQLLVIINNPHYPRPELDSQY